MSDIKRKSSKRHPWEESRFKVVLTLLKQRIKNFPKAELSILDMGCGDTYFVECLAKELPLCNFHAVDIEFSNKYFQELEIKFSGTNINVYKNLEDIKNVAQIDIVLLLDVIEHIEDDIDFLRWMQTFNHINTETSFVITVPAFQSLFCTHDVFLGHFRRYSNTSLKEHITASSLIPELNGYFFTTLLFPRWLQVTKEKRSQDKIELSTGLVEWEGSNVKSFIIRSVLLLDFRFTYLLKKTGINTPGLSNYIICRPSK